MLTHKMPLPVTGDMTREASGAPGPTGRPGPAPGVPPADQPDQSEENETEDTKPDGSYTIELMVHPDGTFTIDDKTTVNSLEEALKAIIKITRSRPSDEASPQDQMAAGYGPPDATS